MSLKMKRFIEIGANLTDLMYTGVYNGSKKHQDDLDQVLKRSWDSGLEKIIITGGSLSESQKALELAGKDERLFATVGCHPTRCTEFEQHQSGPEDYLAELKKLATSDPKKIVAIGECGLDYDRTQFCPPEVQRRYFEMQIRLSSELKLPLFLHCRNAAADLVDILGKYSGLKGVVHSFDGTAEEAGKFLEMGYYIGLNGCSLKSKENLDTVSQIPEDRILVETDCPWCEIRPTHAGFKMISEKNFWPSAKKEKWSLDSMVKGRNEPANIRQVLDVIAQVKSCDPADLSAKIYKNTSDLFFP